MSIKKDDLKAVWLKTKEATKKAALKTKEVAIKTKDYIDTTIENHKREKELKHQQEVEEYNKVINSIKESISDPDVLVFFNNLGQSPTELTGKLAKKIKETFPVPREQTILWSCFLLETNRTGGIAVTEEGVFIKTLVNVFDEKAFKKANRKSSELFYCRWNNIDPGFFDSERANKMFASFGSNNISSFKSACRAFDERREMRRSSTAGYYSYQEQILAGGSVAISGSLLKGTIKLVRDNGAGNNPQAGFGLFAEQANNMNDIAHLKFARVVGGNNAKNGPDRLVNGVNIQTKYYKTGARSVGATFDNKGTGYYRYWNEDGTPMKLEVPKGQYESAVKTFRKKIVEGKVRNGDHVITDPNEAENIIVEGHYTMEQAEAIAKAGTIDSLIYDFKKGTISTTCVFGISFLIDSFLCYRKTHDHKEAVISGLCAGGKAGALTLLTHMIICQLARTETFSEIMTKHVIKSGAVSALVGFLVFSIPETYNFAMKRISGAQYAANLAVLSASIIGGTVGAYAGGAIGTAAGTAAGAGAGSVPLAIAGGAGGVAGGLVLGTAAGVGTSKLIDIFFEGDEKRLSRLFNAVSCEMFAEYLLDESEIDAFIQRMNSVSDRIFKKAFGDIHASNHQIETTKEFLRPYLEEIVNKREKYIPQLDLLLE